MQGRIQDFQLGGGGGQKIMCANAQYESETQSPFRQWFRARRRALGALGVFILSLSLSRAICYLSFTFKHSDTNWDIKKKQSIKF